VTAVRAPVRRGFPERTAALALALAASVLLLAGPGLLLGAVPASAHASLVRVVPADGVTVQTAPTQVQLLFDENVRSPSTVVVTGPDGAAVQRGTVEVVDNSATVPVRVTSAGTYHVVFRVLSADGHPVTGETTFAYRTAGTSPSTDASAMATVGSAEHGHDSAAAGRGVSTGRVVGIVAVVALLAGLALLTVRRLPGGLVNPPRKDGP
jgi:copper resistance protein C